MDLGVGHWCNSQPSIVFSPMSSFSDGYQIQCLEGTGIIAHRSFDEIFEEAGIGSGGIILIDGPSTLPDTVQAFAGIIEMRMFVKPRTLSPSKQIHNEKLVKNRHL